MALFGRKTRRSCEDGRTADTAITFRSGFSEVDYIAHEYTCPHCGSAGGKEKTGHARMARVLPNGKGQVFDLSGVQCSCGCFFTFWMDVTSTSSRFLDGCRPNGNFWFISGHDPLPIEACEVVESQAGVMVLGEPGVSEESGLAGPVAIASMGKDVPKSMRGGVADTGCGHVQYAFIGPSTKEILDVIGNQAMYRNAALGADYCAICRARLSGMYIVVCSRPPDTLRSYANSIGLQGVPIFGRTQGCSEPDDFEMSLLSRFSDEDKALARREVVAIFFTE